jgi:hypothetical protein
MGMPERKESMIRVQRVEARNSDQLEEETNTALAALEEAGQKIISVQFHIPGGAARSAFAFVVYDDRAGIQKDWAERHNQRLLERSQAAAERVQGPDRERRASGR